MSRNHFEMSHFPWQVGCFLPLKYSWCWWCFLIIDGEWIKLKPTPKKTKYCLKTEWRLKIVIVKCMKGGQVLMGKCSMVATNLWLYSIDWVTQCWPGPNKSQLIGNVTDTDTALLTSRPHVKVAVLSRDPGWIYRNQDHWCYHHSN